MLVPKPLVSFKVLVFFKPLIQSQIINIISVKKFMVGYEMLANPQRDISAEWATEQLRNQSQVHYKKKRNMKKLTKLFYLLAGLGVMACSNQNEKSSTFDGTTMSLADSSFVGNVDGKNINLITLKNNKGTIAQFTNFGGRLVSFILPDKNQKPVDIIVGPGSLKDFLSCKEKYFGMTLRGLHIPEVAY